MTNVTQMVDVTLNNLSKGQGHSFW